MGVVLIMSRRRRRFGVKLLTRVYVITINYIIITRITYYYIRRVHDFGFYTSIKQALCGQIALFHYSICTHGARLLYYYYNTIFRYTNGIILLKHLQYKRHDKKYKLCAMTN